MDIYSALADSTRRQIVEMLAAKGHLSASDISNQFTMSAPAISQHLKILRESQVVTVEKKAQQRIYTINTSSISDIEHWVSKIRLQMEERYDRLDSLLKSEHKKK
jgi:DNA-binding transcriptional ArsR family regulator